MNSAFLAFSAISFIVVVGGAMTSSLIISLLGQLASIATVFLSRICKPSIILKILPMFLPNS